MRPLCFDYPWLHGRDSIRCTKGINCARSTRTDFTPLTTKFLNPTLLYYYTTV